MTNTVDFSLLADSGARQRSFKAGETIFKEGDRGDEMFVVQSGHVEIRRGNRVLETLSEKNIFGEMALIDDGPRSATVVAKTDVTVVPVGEKQFLFLVSETPFFALNVMRTLVRRLRAANEAI
ncbi:MAG: cyclic nucleotide-binding domain-containing protein [Bradyrhizobiaceae bacterium]|nr:cyclic nucleotide-binding domain-containing protein [Bradyrhizobiaceae bacterium]